MAVQIAEPIQDRAAGTAFRATSVIDSDRYRDLDRREQFYNCTQHDYKTFDFDGRIIQTGQYTAQRLMSAELAPWPIPMRMRKPSSPYRLGRSIVKAFTAMLLGKQRWPRVQASGDKNTTEFAEALVLAADIPQKFIKARNLGGGMGTVGISWQYDNGVPRVEVHNAKYLYVHSWINRAELIPEHVTEVYRYPVDEWDPTRGRMMRNWYWFRQDWTPEAHIVFKPAPFAHNQEPEWIIDQEASNQHNDGVSHFVWIQNTETEGIDGLPDYDGLYENLDTMDLLCSALARGTVLNLDPTLVLRMDRDLVNAMGVKKGSDNALITGKDGDAGYLELAGTAVAAGIQLFEVERRKILEVAQCIIADPNQLAASGISSVAIKALYAPMIQQTETMRGPYGVALIRLIEQMVHVAQARAGEKITIRNEETGEDEEAAWVVNLPPKIIETPILDPETGKETDDVSISIEEYNPGAGSQFTLTWGDWFAPTPDDQTKVITALSMATGGKAIMHKQSAAEEAAKVYGRDPAIEWRRISGGDADQLAAQAEMFPGTGGEGEDGAMHGAPPTSPTKIQLTSTDYAVIYSVNEIRKQNGDGPLIKSDGTEDPDGYLTIAEFKAKRAALIAKLTMAESGMPTKPGVPAKEAAPAVSEEE